MESKRYIEIRFQNRLSYDLSARFFLNKRTLFSRSNYLNYHQYADNYRNPKEGF